MICDDVYAFLDRDLALDRFDSLLAGLWFAGRLKAPSPLHKHISLKREVVITEHMDLHLVWGNGRLMLKPLPEYLLESAFWDRYLTCGPRCSGPPHNEKKDKNSSSQARCMHSKYRHAALGFLFTYACLITYESDFHIAQRLYLIPQVTGGRTSTWMECRAAMIQILSDHDATRVHERFLYGELRLNRLNMLHFSRHLRLYYRQYTTYSDVIIDNLGWIAASLVYVAVVLSAMQVGLTTSVLQDEELFNQWSYGFAVFAIIAPIGVATIIGFALLIDGMLNVICVHKDMNRARQNANGHNEARI